MCSSSYIVWLTQDEVVSDAGDWYSAVDFMTSKLQAKCVMSDFDVRRQQRVC